MNQTPNLLTKHCIVAVWILLILPWSSLCQDNFAPIPKELEPKYRIDFARNFFASSESEKSSRAELFAALKNLEKLKGKIGNSAENLLNALELSDSIQIQFYRHYAYLYLRYAVNTDDETSIADSSALEAEVDKRTAFLRQELIQLSDRSLSVFLTQRPLLKNYLFAIEDIRRYRPHTLSLKEEELLSATTPLATEWQYGLYQKLLLRNQLGIASVGKDAANIEKQPATADGDTERALREAKFKQYYAGFASQRDLYAFTLIQLAAARTQHARLSRFDDAPSQSYFDSYWTKAEVSNLLEQVAGQSDLYKRYEHLQIEYIKKLAGYRDVNIWDLSVASKDIQTPRFTINQASEIIKNALAPLGPEYGRELANLLDPANGRIDIVPGKNREYGGFSKGFIGTNSVFFSGGFNGSYEDVRVLAHESTHAVHRQLMNTNNILPAYAEGPHYLFEAFAVLNEFLLPDYLYDHETNPALKRYYLEQFLALTGMKMFVVTPKAMLEETIYDGVARGTIKGADDLDVLTKRIYSRFSIFPGKHGELKNQWMGIKLMFQDPFYDINYVYATLLALRFYEIYRRDPQHFVPRYIALMRNGFDAPPEVLLKRFLDIDIHDARLLPDALKVLEEKLNLLETNYRN